MLIHTCRPAVLGGHVEQCNGCGQLRIAYNSCRNGFHRIRHYGYLANGQRAAELADCRRLLVVPEPAPPAPAADYRERYQQLTRPLSGLRSGGAAESTFSASSTIQLRRSNRCQSDRWAVTGGRVTATTVSTTCWICGDPATSGEHGTKRSDLRDVFGTVTQGNPLFLHNAQRRNRRVGSLDAKVLKLPGKLCANCNNTRTQPHDLAWEKLSAGLRIWNPALGAGTIVWPNRIFGADRVREMLNVHLYFVKLFGCHIAGNNIPIDITGFADAIMQGRPHPRVYLKLWCDRIFDGKPLVGMTDMWIAPPPIGGLSPFATWFYDLGFVGINVMYAVPGEKRQGLIGAWHPRQGATRLTISGYRDDECEGDDGL